MNESRVVSSRDLAHDARRALGIDDLVLAVHDASFPSEPGEDVGRGTPYSRGAQRLLDFADGLGFTGLQLGPQGVTTRVNRSPYDGSVFSRNPLSISLDALRRDPLWVGLIDDAILEAATSKTPAGRGRAHHAVADEAQATALDAMFERFVQASNAGRFGGLGDLRGRFEAFRREAAWWLEHDAEFEARAAEAGSDDPSRWPVDLAPGPAARRCAERYVFAQFVVHAQHAAFRSRLQALGWKVFGDMQIGLSPRDRWRREALFLERYALGAPPSRTDPLGQPWGYGVLRPDSREARAFFRGRIHKMAREYDGVRIDHPHGLVCPWVYDRTVSDALRAVGQGARLHESPDLPYHRALSRYAIARPEQIDRSVPRHADLWVRALDPDQVERYAENIAVVVDELAAAGSHDIACEVLSTAPFPLVEVLRRYALGRFRVTQKADLANPRDGYRSENAEPRDWIMVGTHDTAPLARVVDGWLGSGTAGARAAYLAERLVRGGTEAAPDAPERTAFAGALARDRGSLVRAMFADLFASPARHVLVFMSDLFGLVDVYNTPGSVSEANWSLRIPNDFESAYRAGLAAGTAMDVFGALALALRAREPSSTHAHLVSELERRVRAP
jgi:4-alpha-glucanotransferase